MMFCLCPTRKNLGLLFVILMFDDSNIAAAFYHPSRPSSSSLSSNLQRCHFDQRRFLETTATTCLHAKRGKRRNNDTRRGKVGKRGRRSNTEVLEVDHNESSSSRTRRTTTAATVPKPNVKLPPPSSIRNSFIRLLEERPNQRPIDVCISQIVDKNWWSNQNEQSNPFGARLWPSSLACAKFLCKYLLLQEEKAKQQQHDSSNNNTIVIEIGCGTGLVSIGAAAAAAAAATTCGDVVTTKVIATDITEIALSLTKIGWVETQKRNSRKTNNNDNDKEGTLSVRYFDIFSKEPLSQLLDGMIQQQQQQRDEEVDNKTSISQTSQIIIVASAVLYDRALGKGIAYRVYEAIKELNAWFILGDCDTGLRDGGRDMFETELQRLIMSNSNNNNNNEQKTTFPSSSSCYVSYHDVKQKEFGWTNKPVQIIHYNPPDDFIVGGSVGQKS